MVLDQESESLWISLVFVVVKKAKKFFHEACGMEESGMERLRSCVWPCVMERVTVPEVILVDVLRDTIAQSIVGFSLLGRKVWEMV